MNWSAEFRFMAERVLTSSSSNPHPQTGSSILWSPPKDAHQERT